MAKYERNPDVIATLSEEEFWVTQQSGTERAGTGKLLYNKEPGLYVDIVSGEPLLASSDKYESGCGRVEFHQTDRSRPCERISRYQPWHGAHRSKKPAWRQSPWSCVSRWSKKSWWFTLLHQFCLTTICAS